MTLTSFYGTSVDAFGCNPRPNLHPRGISRLLYGSTAERAARFHEILDLDGGGTVTASEIKTVLSVRSRRVHVTTGTSSGALNVAVLNVMHAIDKDGDGNITVDGKTLGW